MFNSTASTSISVTVPETTANGTSILNITLFDADISSILNIGILSGNVKNAFTFTRISDNSNNASRTQYQAIAQLSVASPLDYQFRNVYTLVLFACDTNNLALINVTVNILPGNAKAPVFDFQPGSTIYQYFVTEGASEPILRGDNVCPLSFAFFYTCICICLLDRSS